MEDKIIAQGAEAKVYRGTWDDKECVIKERFVKKYRLPELDQKITKLRMNQESRNMGKAQKAGISVPALYHTDHKTRKLYFEKLQITVKDLLRKYDDFYGLKTIHGDLIGQIGR